MQCSQFINLYHLTNFRLFVFCRQRLIDYHHTVIEKIQANQSNSASSGLKNGRKPSDLELFPGFKAAIEACMLDWEDYPIPGVTYGHNSHYLCPFAVFKLNESDHSQVNSSQAVLRCEYPGRPRSGAADLPRPNESVEDLHQRKDQQPPSLASEAGTNSDEGVGDEAAPGPVLGEPLDADQVESGNESGTDQDLLACPALAVGGAAGEPVKQPKALLAQDDNYEVYFYDTKDMVRLILAF